MNLPKTSGFANSIRPALISISLAGVLASSVSVGADERRGGDRHERRGPPPEAFEACAAAQAGDVCDVVTRRGDTLTGQCVVPQRRQRPDDTEQQSIDTNTGTDALVCRPERHHRQEQSELT